MEMLLTIEQAALRLQLHRDTVRKQLKRGQLRGVKRGRVWRVPESALVEVAPLALAESALAESALAESALAESETIWREMISGEPGLHNAAILKMAAAPTTVRAILARRSAEAAAAYYATPQGESELADWRAASAPVCDDSGDFYTAEEEVAFRQARDNVQR